VFEAPCQKVMTVGQSSLRTLDASGQTLAFPISYLPRVELSHCIETLHLSFYNRPIRIYLPILRNITLVNSINCLNDCSSFPTTIRSIRILLFYRYPNYMPPNWPMILDSLSTLPQRSSLRIFMYDLLKTVDDKSCEMIAKVALLSSDFGFCFRYKFGSPDDDKLIKTVFKDHRKFIKRLCHHILLLFQDEKPFYSIEDDRCGLTMWF